MYSLYIVEYALVYRFYTVCDDNVSLKLTGSEIAGEMGYFIYQLTGFFLGYEF